MSKSKFEKPKTTLTSRPFFSHLSSPFFQPPPPPANIRDLVVESDPDVVIGYNTTNFDLPYLLDRAVALKVADFPFFGRCARSRVKMRDTTFSSKAYGTRDMKEITIEGRVQVREERREEKEFQLFFGSFRRQTSFAHLFLLFSSSSKPPPPPPTLPLRSLTSSPPSSASTSSPPTPSTPSLPTFWESRRRTSTIRSSPTSKTVQQRQGGVWRCTASKTPTCRSAFWIS